jgi:hypothetical protein
MRLRALAGVAVLAAVVIVGMPFEAPGVRQTAFPQAGPFASMYILNPPHMLQTFTRYGLDALKAVSHGA